MGNGNCSGGGVFVAVLAGGLIGAGLALLYAPVAGKETRAKIGDITEDIMKKTKGLGADVRKRGESFMDEEKSIIRAAYDAGRDAVCRRRPSECSPAGSPSARKAPRRTRRPWPRLQCPGSRMQRFLKSRKPG